MHKRYIFTTLFIISMISSGVLGQAKLSIPEDKFKFGIIPQNSTVSHVFWIYSTGLDTLDIVEVRPGCGCTKAPLEKELLAPGDSAYLEIIYSSKKYRNKQVKRPRITSNAKNGFDIVTIISDVTMFSDSTYPILIKPFGIDLTYPMPKDNNNTFKSDFVISNVSDKDLKLEIVDVPKDMFKLKLPKKIKAGDSKVCNLELKKDFKSVNFKKSVTFDMIGTDTTRFTIPVKKDLP